MSVVTLANETADSPSECVIGNERGQLKETYAAIRDGHLRLKFVGPLGASGS